MILNNLNNNRACSVDGIGNMIRILGRQRTGINICHINAQSLKNKMDEFGFIFENSGMDFICVSETWFNSDVFDSFISINGYEIQRVDRATHAGGVAIYIKTGIKFSVVCTSNDVDFVEDVDGIDNAGEVNLVEYLFLEIKSEGRKFLLGSVYRPNKSINMSRFMKTLWSLTACYDDIVIVGDFNSNILVDCSFLNNMIPLGLQSPNICMPTHFTTTTNTLLDLFLVNNISKVLLYDQISAPCFSKHDLIFIAYDFHLKMADQLVTFRDFKHLDYGLLANEFAEIDWNSLYYMTSADDQLSFLVDNINSLFNLTVPLRTKTLSQKQKPWFSSSIKRAISRRDIAYSRWKRFKTDQLHEEYHVARKEANKMIKRAKSEYYSVKFSAALGSKKTWQTIREIGIDKSAGKNPITIDVNSVNENFINIPMVEADRNYYHDIDEVLEHDNFSFIGVNQHDVLSSCLSIKSNAVGADGIHPRFIKMLLPQLLPFVTFIFNNILTTSLYPSIWKNAKIIPIPKSKSEYRPIAILPFLSKVFERLIHNQITTFLNNNNLLTERQSGFRKKHSCTTALVDVAEDLREEIENDKVSFLVLLDHSKAFDTVDHSILCLKLDKMFNFSSTATHLISSYLSNRSQYVESFADKSYSLSIFRGVPQGSILGPLLFSLYANDLPSKLQICKVRMYADDVQLYVSCKLSDIQQCISDLNHDLQRVYLWATANGLSINPNKSKCLIIKKRLQVINITPIITINNQTIEIANSVKNLGIYFNSTLTWSDHVNYACGRTFSMLRTLWQTHYCTPIKIRILLAKSYLIPILLYGCELFSSCDTNSKKKLNVMFNNITRYVYGLSRRRSVSSFSVKLYDMSFDNFLKTRVLLFLHKIIYTRQPEHLSNRLIHSRSSRGRRLILFRHHTLISEWQFFLYAIRLWNTLPHSSQVISNAQHFKKMLYDLFKIL